MRIRKSFVIAFIATISLTTITSTYINHTDLVRAEGMTEADKEREKKRPVVKTTYPYDKEGYVNPMYLWRNFGSQRGNYISLTFKSDYGGLLTSGVPTVSSGFVLNLNGESSNLVDDSRNLQIDRSTDNKEITFFIPVKDEWSEGAKYTAYAPPNLVYFKNAITGTTETEDIPNNEHAWEFTIDSTPTVNKVLDASVPEGFSEKEYIEIEGNNFRYGTSVEFVSSTDPRKTYYAYNEIYRSDNKNILRVYLPRGRNSLPVGTYDIMVSNGRDYESTHKYGVFSVVPKGNYIPNEEYNKKDVDVDGKYINIGEVEKYTKTSSDTLVLDSRYANSFNLYLDLDKLMGEDVRNRNIEYRGDSFKTINILNAYSKHADITLYGVRLKNYTRDKDISIKTGRVDPNVSYMLKNKLADKDIKSDFIKVSGDNYSLSSLNMKLPFKNSDGNNLRVLRYDESERRFSELNFKVNKVDKAVELTSMEKGIFVVIE